MLEVALFNSSIHFTMHLPHIIPVKRQAEPFVPDILFFAENGALVSSSFFYCTNDQFLNINIYIFGKFNKKKSQNVVWDSFFRGYDIYCVFVFFYAND